MTYRLVWRPPAFAAMESLVQEIPERRGEFAAALREMSEKMTTDPDAVGESREENIRVGFFGRLTVRFRIATDERKVFVLDVHLPTDSV